MQNGAKHQVCASDVGLVTVSANVQTLKPYQEERSYSQNSIDPVLDKVEALEVQFDSLMYDVVGVQEGRSKLETVSNGLHYRRYAAPATAGGALGVQLWIRKKSRVEVLHWRAINPRSLYAVLRLANGASIVMVVARAPHSLAPEAERGAFWDELTSLALGLQEKYQRAAMRVAIDANGRAGSARSPRIGDVEPAQEDENGARLRSFLDDLSLFAVNTFWARRPTW